MATASAPLVAGEGTKAFGVRPDEVRRFVQDCMVKAGASEANAGTVAEVLTFADIRGLRHCGLAQIEKYVSDVETARCDGLATPEILSEGPATAWVDGRNGLGTVVGDFCMRLAIAKAKDSGVGWVVAKGSNHNVVPSYYTTMAKGQQMIGMSCTNTSPLMVPTRAKQAALGSNPISVAAPAHGGDDFVLDIATASTAFEQIEVHRQLGKPLPPGWALDTQGLPTTDAEEAVAARRLIPLGGEERTGGYKGFGLALMVDVFSGVLAGSMYGPHVRSWNTEDGVADLGQCYVAVDPQRFAPGFDDRMYDLLMELRNLEPVDPERPVMIPGDLERSHMYEVENSGALSFSLAQIQKAEALAKRLGVKPVEVLERSSVAPMDSGWAPAMQGGNLPPPPERQAKKDCGPPEFKKADCGPKEKRE